MDKVPYKKIVSVNFSHVMFFLLGFFTLEDGTIRFYWNIGKELTLYAA